MRQYLKIRDKVEKILKEIPDEKFKKAIEKDVTLFVDAFLGSHSKSVRLNFLIYLEYLSRKHSSSIVTRAYLIKNFNIKRSGWMKRQKKMIEMGIIGSINNPRDHMIPAKRIIDEMGEAGIITDEHYKKISKIFASIPQDYPEAMRGKSKEVIIAFLAICYTSEYETIDDIVLMFRDLEIHRGLSVGDVWEEKLFRTFYKSIQRLKKSGTMVPEFKINIAKYIKAAKLILKDLYDYGLISHCLFMNSTRKVESIPFDYPKVLRTRETTISIAVLSIYSSEPNLQEIAKMFQGLRLKGQLIVETGDEDLLYKKYRQMIWRIMRVRVVRPFLEVDENLPLPFGDYIPSTGKLVFHFPHKNIQNKNL